MTRSCARIPRLRPHFADFTTTRDEFRTPNATKEHRYDHFVLIQVVLAPSHRIATTTRCRCAPGRRQGSSSFSMPSLGGGTERVPSQPRREVCVRKNQPPRMVRIKGMDVCVYSQQQSPSSPSPPTHLLTSPPSYSIMKAVFVALALAVSALAQGVRITQPPAGSTEKQGLPMTVVVQKQVRSGTSLSAPPPAHPLHLCYVELTHRLARRRSRHRPPVLQHSPLRQPPK